MRGSKTIITFVLFLILAGLLSLSFIWQGSFILLSFGIVIVSLLLFFFHFEKRKVEPRELVLLAVLSAIAAVGRVPFASLPSVQPTTFVIMMSGYVFGAESGFTIGAVAALASNMLLGQGPWTPWQMTAWGLVGWTAGMLRRTRLMNHWLGRACFGIVWGFGFGWIMNVWGLAALIQSESHVNLKAFLLYFAASAPFDAMHSLSNVIFLSAFGSIWIKVMTRFKRKYGLLDTLGK